MSDLKKIQIHYTEADGATGVINYFSSDNSPGNAAEREKLLAKATKFAGDWSQVYPETKFSVVER